MSNVAAVVLQAFRAVERRDRAGLIALYHPEIEFHDAPSLPYGGTLRGKEEVARNHGWLETWGPLQPTKAERSMDPRIVATGRTGRGWCSTARGRSIGPASASTHRSSVSTRFAMAGSRERRCSTTTQPQWSTSCSEFDEIWS